MGAGLGEQLRQRRAFERRMASNTSRIDCYGHLNRPFRQRTRTFPIATIERGAR
jgi:hypothetical protein